MLASDRIAVTENKYTLLTESELVALSCNGDSESFRLLYQNYQAKVRSTLYQLCGSAMLDDLLQEVFLRAWKGLPKLKQAEYFSTWIYRICWNVATDYRRKLAKNNHKVGAVPDLESMMWENSSYNSQETDLMQLHYQDLVKRGLEHLNLSHRVVIVLHDLEDIPQKKIAQILDIPVGTVKSRLYHARNTLKKFLQQQGITF
ncbi:RNA polymerase sigma factor, sigma-70 family [Hyella patelloides LEGE 07179]|uniref:RNA polymerase sigma factor, sigma-70 family n=1 Tax=Hyella patelloides LEGE 07179 TaxID=945734 RepID=A0A563VUP6_9CYAN|nr:sigma-70 family RNA polymerase sigma factor [Hyella patelloides]VEP15133.1 RNA polymerase sigma factor, sigma-70 family [Hyella patelloides LEGE 07179]